MAILINKNLSISGGIEIDQAYLRIRYSADLSGKSLSYSVFPYYNKEAYLDNYQENILKIDDLPVFEPISYDSSINGDPLEYIHTSMVQKLTTDVYRTIALLDPSTGDRIYDSSTGELLTEDVIILPKFTEISEVSIEDLD